MQYKTDLEVQGVDLGDLDTLARIDKAHVDVVWSSVDGRVVASVLTEEPLDPVCSVTEAAHRIENTLPGAIVARVDEDLVGISDIAIRTGLNRETIRTWVAGSRGPGKFPTPRGSIGGGNRGATRVWAWADVAAWLKGELCLEDEYLYLSSSQVAEVNAHLARAHQSGQAQWKVVDRAGVLTSGCMVLRPSLVYKASTAVLFQEIFGHRDEHMSAVRIGQRAGVAR